MRRSWKCHGVLVLVMCRNPVQIDYRFQHFSTQPISMFVFSLRYHHNLSFFSTTDVDTDDVQFEICPFQDNCNGAVTQDVSDCIVCIGCFQSHFQRVCIVREPLSLIVKLLAE